MFTSIFVAPGFRACIVGKLYVFVSDFCLKGFFWDFSRLSCLFKKVV